MLSMEDETFLAKEKGTQMFLFTLLLVHMLGIIPLNIFK